MNLEKCAHFVLDECDNCLEKLDMRGDVQKIFVATPKKKQARRWPTARFLLRIRFCTAIIAVPNLKGGVLLSTVFLYIHVICGVFGFKGFLHSC